MANDDKDEYSANGEIGAIKTGRLGPCLLFRNPANFIKDLRFRLEAPEHPPLNLVLEGGIPRGEETGN